MKLACLEKSVRSLAEQRCDSTRDCLCFAVAECFVSSVSVRQARAQRGEEEERPAFHVSLETVCLLPHVRVHGCDGMLGWRAAPSKTGCARAPASPPPPRTRTGTGAKAGPRLQSLVPQAAPKPRGRATRACPRRKVLELLVPSPLRACLLAPALDRSTLPSRFCNTLHSRITGKNAPRITLQDSRVFGGRSLERLPRYDVGSSAAVPREQAHVGSLMWH